jgi:hypothetical protein
MTVYSNSATVLGSIPAPPTEWILGSVGWGYVEKSTKHAEREVDFKEKNVIWNIRSSHNNILFCFEHSCKSTNQQKEILRKEPIWDWFLWRLKIQIETFNYCPFNL